MSREFHLQLENRWTDDVQELTAEFDRIRACMESLGLRVIGYDPGVLVVDANNPHNSNSFDIPTWFLKRLLERTEGRQDLVFNGLTETETNATASVAGLTKP